MWVNVCVCVCVCECVCLLSKCIYGSNSSNTTLLTPFYSVIFIFVQFIFIFLFFVFIFILILKIILIFTLILSFIIYHFSILQDGRRDLGPSIPEELNTERTGGHHADTGKIKWNKIAGENISILFDGIYPSELPSFVCTLNFTFSLFFCLFLFLFLIFYLF